MCCISVSVYGIIFSGWASNSKYALLGGLRAVAQTISYEIVLAFILVYMVFVSKSIRFFEILNQQYGSIKFIFCGLVLRIIFFFRAVAETNRAPFDLAEGESELVSGFNVEYGGLKFALIFMAEYASIFWMRFLIVICYLGASLFKLNLFVIVVVNIFLLLRAAYPRMRYDILIILT